MYNLLSACMQHKSNIIFNRNECAVSHVTLLYHCITCLPLSRISKGEHQFYCGSLNLYSPPPPQIQTNVPILMPPKGGGWQQLLNVILKSTLKQWCLDTSFPMKDLEASSLTLILSSLCLGPVFLCLPCWHRTITSQHYFLNVSSGASDSPSGSSSQGPRVGPPWSAMQTHSTSVAGCFPSHDGCRCQSQSEGGQWGKILGWIFIWEDHEQQSCYNYILCSGDENEMKNPTIKGSIIYFDLD